MVWGVWSLPLGEAGCAECGAFEAFGLLDFLEQLGVGPIELIDLRSETDKYREHMRTVKRIYNRNANTSSLPYAAEGRLDRKYSVREIIRACKHPVARAKVPSTTNRAETSHRTVIPEKKCYNNFNIYF